MSTTWDVGGGGTGDEESRAEWVTLSPPKTSAWKKVAMQVGVLAVLAVVGAAGGAAIASWSTDDGAPETVAAAASAAPEMDQPREVDAPPAVREASAEPAAETPAEEPVELAEAGTPDPARLETLFPEDDTSFAAAPDEAAAETAEPPVREVAADEPVGIDDSETASIVSPGEPVAVAETEEEAARLEELMVEEETGPDASAEPLQQTAMAAPSQPPAGSMSAARAAEYVNLRTGPGNDSEVIRVIPANAELLAEETCVHWCAVVHEGTEGYIYKSFIAR